LCQGACGRIPSCTDPTFSYKVDLEKCQKKCVEEVTGAGLLIQEIALQFYTGMRDDPKGCTYPRSGYKSHYWAQFLTSDPKAFESLKEPELMVECVEGSWKCYDGEKNDYLSSCFSGHYRYNAEIRAKKSACLKLKCPDSYYCWSGASISGTFWMDGIEIIHQ
jgi:hypothetical protein